jgi:hypothetical protein
LNLKKKKKTVKQESAEGGRPQQRGFLVVFEFGREFTVG